MGISYEQAERLGPHVAALHPDAPGNAGPKAAAPTRKRSKYGNKVTAYNGVPYASKAEAARAEVLDELLKAGSVRFVYPHPRFRLGVRENVYVSDFLVVDGDGRVHVEDVKGKETAKFARDRKLWRAYGPCDLWIIKGKTVERVIPKRLETWPPARPGPSSP